MNVQATLCAAKAIPLICFAAGLLSAGQAAVARQAAPVRSEFVTTNDSTIHVTSHGNGPTVVLLPGNGRGVEDFDDLSIRLAQAGYRAVLPQPRGIGRSTGRLEGLTLHDLAADVAAVIRMVGDAPITIVGHAFGNRIARMVAADYPTLVKQVILLGAGGKVPPSAENQEATRRALDPTLPREERLTAMRRAYFARGNDASVWMGGWHATREAFAAASRATPIEDWWAAGSVPILLLQGAEDDNAPAENAKLLASEYRERVTVIQIEGAGHAMLPEQPERIAAEVIAFLRR